MDSITVTRIIQILDAFDCHEAFAVNDLHPSDYDDIIEAYDAELDYHTYSRRRATNLVNRILIEARGIKTEHGTLVCNMSLPTFWSIIDLRG